MSPETKTVPLDSGRILIVGGYGEVGLSIAERLARLFPGRVTIAGRNLKKATAAAVRIGHGAEGRAVDLYAAESVDALDGVALVLVSLDQTDTRFVEQCLSRGIHYVDISANYGFMSQVEELDQLAKQNDVTALLSVGVAPGLTNMLAAKAHEGMEQVDRIDILIEFGLGDTHGKAAVEWMFDNLDAEYEVKENGRPKSVRSFSENINVRLPGQRKERPAYRFNFPDQQVVGRTLGVPSVGTWIQFENRLSTWLFAKSSQAGLGRLLRRRWWRKIAVWLFMNVRMGSDICGVAARATGRTKDGSVSMMRGLIGRNEALMTAIVAAESVRQLLSGKPVAGVLHSEQAITLGPVVSALKKDLPDLVVAV